MKLLVVALSGLLAAASVVATPLEAGYGIPVATPIQQVTIPVAPPVVVPAPAAPAVHVTRTVVPFTATRVFSRPPVVTPFAAAPVRAPLPLSPSPLRTLAPIAPAALPAPAPIPAALPPPLPLVRSPVAALSPAPIPAPLAVPSSQFHAQDEFGGVNFGYQNINSARQEVRTPDGVTRGSYSYIDSNGVPQTVNYIADALGFRVEATNLPVAPAVPEAPAAVPVVAPAVELPEPVVDTPEVAAARAEFQKAFDAAVVRAEIEAAGEAAAEPAAIIARRKRSAIEEGYGVPVAPVVPVPAPVPVAPAPPPAVAPVVPVPAPTPFIQQRTSVLTHPIAPVLPAVVPASPRILPVGPAPIIPGPIRTIPAAAATVRTPLTAAVSPLAPNPLLAVAPAPLPTVTPAVIPSTQFQAQDEAGGVSFGYQNLNSARQETRTPDGVTRGSYSYVDANGITQTVHYVADALGFRVAATNLPVAA